MGDIDTMISMKNDFKKVGKAHPKSHFGLSNWSSFKCNDHTDSMILQLSGTGGALSMEMLIYETIFWFWRKAIFNMLIDSVVRFFCQSCFQCREQKLCYQPWKLFCRHKIVEWHPNAIIWVVVLNESLLLARKKSDFACLAKSCRYVRGFDEKFVWIHHPSVIS